MWLCVRVLYFVCDVFLGCGQLGLVEQHVAFLCRWVAFPRHSVPIVFPSLLACRSMLQNVFEHSRACWAYVLQRSSKRTYTGDEEFVAHSVICPLSKTRLLNPVRVPGVALPMSRDAVLAAIAGSVCRCSCLRLLVPAAARALCVFSASLLPYVAA